MTTPVRPGDTLCQTADLAERGPGLRFLVECEGRIQAAFAIRHAGTVHAYLNRCAHKLVELDWEPGQFFDAGHQHLICATHGALYDPASGLCVAGPCRGARLVAIPVCEADGQVRLAGIPENMVK